MWVPVSGSYWTGESGNTMDDMVVAMLCYCPGVFLDVEFVPMTLSLLI